jgi:hypothetical protein
MRKTNVDIRLKKEQRMINKVILSGCVNERESLEKETKYPY